MTLFRFEAIAVVLIAAVTAVAARMRGEMFWFWLLGLEALIALVLVILDIALRGVILK